MTNLWASLIIARFDIKETLGTPSAILSLLFSTCMSLVIISMVLSGSGAQFSERIRYLFPGILGLQALMCLALVSRKIQSDRGNGTFILMLMSPAAPQSLVVGHLGGAIVRVMVQGAALFVVVSLLLGEVTIASVQGAGVVVLSLIMGTVLFGSVGLVLRILFANLSQFVLTIVMSLGTISSTAYFTRESIPASLRPLAGVNPVSFLCDSLRSGTTMGGGDYGSRSMGMLTVLTVVALALALVCSRQLERQTEGL